MPYTRTILCLAKSDKHNEYCFAGKDIRTGEWIRPVSNRADEAISHAECTLATGVPATMLDIVEIPFLRATPQRHQRENHLIDATRRWTKRGAGTWRQVQDLLDKHQGPLWLNDSASRGYSRNRVAEAALDRVENSLILLRPERLSISIEIKGGIYQDANRRLVKARFTHSDVEYVLAVTDPVVKTRFQLGPDRVEEMADAVVCVSLGEVHRGEAYKLVAAVLAPPRGA